MYSTVYLLHVVLHGDAAEGDGEDAGHVEDLRYILGCQQSAKSVAMHAVLTVTCSRHAVYYKSCLLLQLFCV